MPDNLRQEYDDGEPVVLQLAPRSNQLNGIADEFQQFLEIQHKLHEFDIVDLNLRIHQLKGYCEQLRIIADELDKAEEKITILAIGDCCFGKGKDICDAVENARKYGGSKATKEVTVFVTNDPNITMNDPLNIDYKDGCFLIPLGIMKTGGLRK